MDNVIKFPTKINNNEKYVPLDEEEIGDRVDDMKFLHIQETMLPVLHNLFSSLAVAGFDFSIEEDEEDPFLKDGALVVESIKAMLCKHHGIEHPLSIIADVLFVPNEDDDEEGSFKIADNISITMKTTNPDSE